MEEATVHEIRRQIEDVPKREYRLALQFEFLAAARRCEVTGKWYYPAENTSLEECEGSEIVLFQVKSAKKQRGKLRPVALPLEPKYEPWTQDLYDYMMEVEEGKAFNFSDKTLYRAAVDAFQGLDYFIMQYPTEKGIVEQHWRSLATHGLRHLRAKNLVDQYGFDGYQLATYCGWSLRSTIRGMPTIAERYITLQWKEYISRLFKPLNGLE